MHALLFFRTSDIFDLHDALPWSQCRLDLNLMDLLVTGAVDMGGSGVLGNYNGQQEDIGVRFWAWL